MRFTASAVVRSLAPLLCAALPLGCARQGTESPASAPAESASSAEHAPPSAEAAPPADAPKAAPAPAEPAQERERWDLMREPSAEGNREPEPQTLAEAEQLLARAEAELERLAPLEPRASVGSARARDARGSAPAGAGAAPAPARKKGENASAESKADGRSACETACRAFSSLERASQAVCRLDAANGERCERARKIRESAARRVASCGCAS